MMKVVERLLLPVLFLVFGVLCAGLVFGLSPKAERREVSPKVARVEVVVAEAAARVVRVRGSGVMSAARAVVLTPEVSGRVVRVAPEAMPGGRLRKGQPFVWLDDRDLRAALDADRARLKQAELERALEVQRGESAVREWDLLRANGTDSQAELALRRHHLALAEANLASAQAAVERAERNVARTVITAPFDALVISENVEIGQVAQPGSQLASLVGTEALWVSVSVPVDKLTLIDIPGFNADSGAGSQVVLRQRLGEGEVSRIGQVIRLAGQLDPQTRTAAVLVEVQRPFDPPAGELPLLPGAHVDADIAGRALEDVFELPRVAVFDGSSVWVVDGEERLLRRDLQLGWRGADTVYVTDGLSAGERVVVTPMGLPVQGMPVQATLQAPAPGQEG